ncbi:unnamed protein product [Rangifer tarandus platyrhynchus]|uniref:Basic proline-rich protein-like n=1 Tax=Rangifer tarandus platyrhynchus TaxID=3082113 RepID=A0ABN8ZTC5_RANTA|nr:unnamed protein product [Rangifer tarandus platyrhynchus]
MSRIRGRGALEEVGGRSFHGGLTCKQAGASGTCREERGAWAAVDSGRRELVVVGKTPPGCLKAAGVVDAPKGDSQAPCPSPHATSYSLRPLQHPLPHGGGPDPGEPPPRALRKRRGRGKKPPYGRRKTRHPFSVPGIPGAPSLSASGGREAGSPTRGPTRLGGARTPPQLPAASRSPEPVFRGQLPPALRRGRRAECPRPTCSLAASPPLPPRAPRGRRSPLPPTDRSGGASPPSAPGLISFFFRKVGPRSPRPTEPAPGPIQPEPGRRGRGGPSAPEQHAQAPATCREAPRAGLSPPAGVPAPLHPPPPRVPQAPTYRLGPAGERARAGAPGDSVFRPGRKVCAMQRGRRGGRRGRQGVGAGRAARRARASVPPASGACVLPESPRPPRSRSRRPEPGALRPQPRRAPVAAARPPPILPLPLNSRATDAERHLRGSRRRAPRPPRAPSPRPSAGAPTTPRAPHRAPTIRAPRQPRPRDPRSPRAPAIRAAHGRRSHRPSPRLRSEPRGSPAPLLDPW